MLLHLQDTQIRQLFANEDFDGKRPGDKKNTVGRQNSNISTAAEDHVCKKLEGLMITHPCDSSVEGQD